MDENQVIITSTNNSQTNYINYSKEQIFEEHDNITLNVKPNQSNTWINDQDRISTLNVKNIVNVFDVGEYILRKLGSLTTMKLHKLLYYCHAWSLVWDEQPLFNNKIEAWANGPVIRDLFNFHRGSFTINSIPIGNPKLLTQLQIETIDAVLDYYGDKSSQWLIELTHLEDPWKNSRLGLGPTERGNKSISNEEMFNYYSSL